MTVLFSDIREFTNYSESRDPNEVMKMLNAVMNVQAKIISEFGGDIDKFVGDEIMAVFHGKDMELRAAKAAEKTYPRRVRGQSITRTSSQPGRSAHAKPGLCSTAPPDIYPPQLGMLRR